MTIQEKTARSRAIKRGIRECFAAEIGRGQEAKAIVYEIAGDLISLLSDNQCRDLCFMALQCEDLTAAEQRELQNILYGQI